MTSAIRETGQSHTGGVGRETGPYKPRWLAVDSGEMSGWRKNDERETLLELPPPAEAEHHLHGHQ